MTIKVLALDLERTLITNSINRRARPGLDDFTRYCLDAFEKVVIFSGVSREHVQAVLDDLHEGGLIPGDFRARTEIIDWNGWYKDLAFIQGYEPGEILIVDDFIDYINPEQMSQWIKIQPYLPEGEEEWVESKAHSPDPNDPDRELVRVQELIQERLGE